MSGDSDHKHASEDGPYDWNESYSGSAADYEEPDPLILELIDGLPRGRALDVGCGAGGLVVALAQGGWDVTGIDVAEKAIAAARKVTQERGVKAELHVADATTWTPSGQYELITSSFALPGDTSSRAAVFKMVRDALAPGGRVVLKDFDTSMTRHAFFAAFDLVTVDELTNAFGGFEIVRAEVVATPAHDHDHSGANAGEHWTAALLHALKVSR